MKLERVLRKAAPFLLIAILIACLFNMPRCEGFKGHTKVHSEKSFDRDSKDWFKDNAEPLGITAGVAAVTGGIYKYAQRAQAAAQVRVDTAPEEEEELSKVQRINRETLYRIGGEQRTADEFIKGGDYSPEALDRYSSLPERSSNGIISDGKHVRFADEMNGPLAHTVDETKSGAANFDDEGRDSVSVRSSADTVNMFKDDTKGHQLAPGGEALDKLHMREGEGSFSEDGP